MSKEQEQKHGEFIMMKKSSLFECVWCRQSISSTSQDPDVAIHVIYQVACHSYCLDDYQKSLHKTGERILLDDKSLKCITSDSKVKDIRMVAQRTYPYVDRMKAYRFCFFNFTRYDGVIMSPYMIRFDPRHMETSQWVHEVMDYNSNMTATQQHPWHIAPNRWSTGYFVIEIIWNTKVITDQAAVLLIQQGIKSFATKLQQEWMIKLLKDTTTTTTTKSASRVFVFVNVSSSSSSYGHQKHTNNNNNTISKMAAAWIPNGPFNERLVEHANHLIKWMKDQAAITLTTVQEFKMNMVVQKAHCQFYHSKNNTVILAVGVQFASHDTEPLWITHTKKHNTVYVCWKPSLTTALPLRISSNKQLARCSDGGVLFECFTEI